MKMNGMMVLLASFFISAAVQIAFADETIAEKVSVTANDAKRGLKKGAHRTEELFCMQDDIECAARKAKNRLQEAGAAASDGASELKNKID